MSIENSWEIHDIYLKQTLRFSIYPELYIMFLCAQKQFHSAILFYFFLQKKVLLFFKIMQFFSSSKLLKELLKEKRTQKLNPIPTSNTARNSWSCDHNMATINPYVNQNSFTQATNMTRIIISHEFTSFETFLYYS